ncbi:MAG: DoxX family protein [Acidimicrobiia bacterium]
MLDPSYAPDGYNLALLIARLWLGGIFLAHGYRHLKAIRSGPGMANWFESLGLRNGKLQAMNVTYLELAAGAALVVGLLTPLAYGGAASIVLVALVTNHKKNGFWSFLPGEGWEYTGTLTAVCIAFGGLGPGKWSLDDAFGLNFPFKPDTALAIAAAIGILGTAVFLAIFWRPPAKQDAAD